MNSREEHAWPLVCGGRGGGAVRQPQGAGGQPRSGVRGSTRPATLEGFLGEEQRKDRDLSHFWREGDGKKRSFSWPGHCRAEKWQ